MSSCIIWKSNVFRQGGVTLTTDVRSSILKLTEFEHFLFVNICVAVFGSSSLGMRASCGCVKYLTTSCCFRAFQRYNSRLPGSSPWRRQLIKIQQIYYFFSFKSKFDTCRQNKPIFNLRDIKKHIRLGKFNFITVRKSTIIFRLITIKIKWTKMRVTYPDIDSPTTPVLSLLVGWIIGIVHISSLSFVIAGMSESFTFRLESHLLLHQWVRRILLSGKFADSWQFG